MKDIKKLCTYILFTLAYAILLSVGFECALIGFGFVLAVAFDGRSAAHQFPRFLPFCVFVGLAALALLVLLVILNVKVSSKLEYTKRIACIQSVCALAISIPMIKIWEILFDFLQRTF